MNALDELDDYSQRFREYVEGRRRRNLDINVATTGREGSGKSSLAIQLALALETDLDPHDIILTYEDYYRVYDPDAKDRVYVFDEAARFAFNRTWNNREQVALIQEIIENRQARSCTFWNLPQFKSLDKYAREGRLDLWHGCYDQGKAMVRALAYDAYTEEAFYPVVIDDLGWPRLEDAYPTFAKVYFARKKKAHTAKFHERKGLLESKKALEEKREKYLEARYEKRLAKYEK